jgi:hypothetical protein
MARRQSEAGKVKLGMQYQTEAHNGVWRLAALWVLSAALLAACGQPNTATVTSDLGTSTITAAESTAVSASGATAEPAIQADATHPAQATTPPTEEATVTEIPPEAQCYFDAVKANDAAAVAACFAEDGVVDDVGRRFEGRAAIQRWAENELIGGTYEILEVSVQPAGAQILLRFAPGGGNGFRARYTFIFANGKITSVAFEYA